MSDPQRGALDALLSIAATHRTLSEMYKHICSEYPAMAYEMSATANSDRQKAEADQLEKRIRQLQALFDM